MADDDKEKDKETEQQKQAKAREQREAEERNVNEELSEYFRETTVHGFRYVVEGRNIFERYVWIAFIIFGFIFSAWIIYNAFEEWEATPVHITVDEVSVPVDQIPYPAITVCDTESLQMPRRNRWMFLERLLNAAQLKDTNDLWIENEGKML